MVDLSLVIPAYNEANGIEPVIVEVGEVLDASGIDYEVVIVDDGSDDGTSDVVRRAAESRERVRLIAHPRNKGYGAALKTGIGAARAEVVAITDADRTYPSERLPDLYRLLVEREADMVVGARTGENVHIPLIRRPMKWVLRMLANYLSGQRIPDLNSGLRVFRRAAAMERFNIISNGFSFTTTITLAFLARQRPVIYEPIDYHRRTGASKIRPIADTLNFITLILRVSIYFEPLKVFLPVAGTVFTAGIAWGAHQAYWQEGLGEAPVLLLVSGLQIFLVGLIADMISRSH